MLEVFVLCLIWSIASLVAGIKGGESSAIYVICMGILFQLIKIVHIMGDVK